MDESAVGEALALMARTTDRSPSGSQVGPPACASAHESCTQHLRVA